MEVHRVTRIAENRIEDLGQVLPLHTLCGSHSSHPRLAESREGCPIADRVKNGTERSDIRTTVRNQPPTHRVSERVQLGELTGGDLFRQSSV